MLDKKKPFGEIFGDCDVAGARYIQNGTHFDAKGKPIAKPVPKNFQKKPEKITPTKFPADDYDNMHHLSLKRLVESRGGTYKDKDSAVNWLKAHDVS